MFKDTSEGQTHSYGDGCNEEHGKISDQELILSLQKQVQDLRENARVYALKNLMTEMEDIIEKRVDMTPICEDSECPDCIERMGYNRALYEILEVIKERNF